jgi:hypothetical protein
MRAAIFPAFPDSLTPCAVAIPTDGIYFQEAEGKFVMIV